MNHKTQLMQNTVIIAIGKLGTKIISFLLLRLYTAKLTTAEYGTYDFLVTLATFLLPIITVLMEESMFRFLIDAETAKEKKRIVTATVFYTLLGGIVFTILSAIIMFIIQYEYGLLFILFVISNLFINLSNCLARGTSKIKLYSLSNFILGALTIVLNVLFIAVFNWGVAGLLWSNIIANMITAVPMLMILKLPRFVGKKYMNKTVISSMVRYSVPLVPNSISWLIITMSDRIMLTAMVGSSENGLYSVANRFPNILYTCYGFFSTAWKESAAKIVKEENKTKYYNGIYHEMKTFLKAVTIGLIAIMPFVFPLLIDKSYGDAYQYIPILVVAIYYTNISSFYGGIFAAYKDTKIMGITTVIAAVMNVVINFIFMEKFQIYAATFSTLISNLIVYIYRRIKLRKYIKLKEKFQVIYWLLLTLTLASYYWNNMIANIIVFLIVLIYCIYTNRKFIGKIILKIKNRHTLQQEG